MNRTEQQAVALGGTLWKPQELNAGEFRFSTKDFSCNSMTCGCWLGQALGLNHSATFQREHLAWGVKNVSIKVISRLSTRRTW